MSARLTTAGIYAFIHTGEQAVYVGQTMRSTTSRRTAHLKLLDKGKHPSRDFQAAYDRTEGSGWEFRIAERPPKTLQLGDLKGWLNEREMYWHEYFTVMRFTHLSGITFIPVNRSHLKSMSVSLSEDKHEMLERLAAEMEWTKGRLLGEYLEHTLTEKHIVDFIQWWIEQRHKRMGL